MQISNTAENKQIKQQKLIDYLKNISNGAVNITKAIADNIISIVYQDAEDCIVKLYKYNWQLDKWDFIKDEKTTGDKVAKEKQASGFGRQRDKHYKFDCYKDGECIASILTLNPGLFN